MGTALPRACKTNAVGALISTNQVPKVSKAPKRCQHLKSFDELHAFLGSVCVCDA